MQVDLVRVLCRLKSMKSLPSRKSITVRAGNNFFTRPDNTQFCVKFQQSWSQIFWRESRFLNVSFTIRSLWIYHHFSSHNSIYTSYHGGNHVCQAVKNDNYVSDEDAVWQLAIHSPLWWSWASMLLLGQLQAPTTTFMLHKYASCLSPRRWVYKYTPHSEMQC